MPNYPNLNYHDAVYNSVLHGRRKLFSDIKPDSLDNIKKIIEKVMPQHRCNASDIKFLYRYWTGCQPILIRKKRVRPEIDNKVVVNIPQEIVTFKEGFIYGSPVQIIQRGNGNESGIDKFNSMLEIEGKRVKDSELGSMLSVCGVAYRLILRKSNANADECPFDILNLKPGSAFVVYSDDVYQRPILGVTYRVNDDGDYIYGAYTDTHYYEFEMCSTGYKTLAEKPHQLGTVPIVEYVYNNARMGAFEAVIPLIDAINLAESDRINGIEQFVQSLLWLHNCELIEDKESLKEAGLIQTKDTGGVNSNIKFLTEQLQQQDTQTVVDDMYQKILEIAGVPDRHSSTGGNTGQALQLAAGWHSTDMQANIASLLFVQSEQRTQRVMLSIVKTITNIDPEIKALSLANFDTKFNRNTMDNILVKTQSLLNMLQAGVAPRIAIATCGIFGDPEQVYQDSVPYMEKWIQLTQTVANNNPTKV